MDNLTHSLTGWAIGQAGLKTQTRKGLAALILGANMPDIDVFFGSFTEKQAAAQKQLWLVPGEKMLFDGGARGLALDTEKLALTMVDGDDPKVIVHNPTNRGVAAMLIEMRQDEGFPVALGVIYEDPRPTFEEAVIEQNAKAAEGKAPDLQALVSKGQTWMVEQEPRPE